MHSYVIVIKGSVRLVVVEPEDGRTAEETVVHVDLARVVVCVRVPQAPDNIHLLLHLNLITFMVLVRLICNIL